MKFLPLFFVAMLLVPLSLSPAAERLPEFSTTQFGPLGAEGLPQPVAHPVPEATSWSLAMGALGCFLLVRRRN